METRAKEVQAKGSLGEIIRRPAAPLLLKEALHEILEA